MTATTFLLGLFTPAARAEEPPKSAELKLLDRFQGAWTTTSTSKVAEWTPKEVKAVGSTTNAWVLNGHFMQAKGADSLPNRFMGQWTYDQNKKAYRMWYFDSQGAIAEFSGPWNEAAQSLLLTADFGNGITANFSIRLADKDAITFQYGAADKAGKVYLAMDGKWTRKR